MFDEHDVVHGLLDGEGGHGLAAVDLAGRRHDLGQAVVESVQVTSEVVLDLSVLVHLFLLFLLVTFEYVKKFFGRLL